jgi:hypothetical protein
LTANSQTPDPSFVRSKFRCIKRKRPKWHSTVKAW